MSTRNVAKISDKNEKIRRGRYRYREIEYFTFKHLRRAQIENNRFMEKFDPDPTA